jgi:hypothetical protein
MNIYNNTIINTKLDYILGKFNFEPKYKSHLLYIIFHIRTYSFKNRDFVNGDFIPIKLEYLRNLINYNKAKKFLDLLVSEGILECDNKYKPGEKSKGYRISEKYNKSKYYLEEMLDEDLSKKIKYKLTELTNQVLKRDDGYSYVTKCMFDLEMDYEEANKYINSKKIPKDIKDRLRITVDIFNEKFAKIDDKGFRLHNNLTNLATPLRKTLTYNGKNIVQCDLKNSQPLLFRYYLEYNYPHIPKDELNKYLNVVTEVGFYEYMAEKAGFKLTEENRTEFKKRVFSGVLFDKNRKKLSLYEEVFKKEFPIIFYCLRDAKKEDNSVIPIGLQKLESDYIFSCVEILKNKYKDIELLTIHDSIATIDGKEKLVYEVMVEQFQKMYNITPKIKIEKFA